MNSEKLSRKPETVCILCGKDFKDGEATFRVAHGTIHYSVPSFAPDHVTGFLHEKCWNLATKEERNTAFRALKDVQENDRDDGGKDGTQSSNTS